jgi:hypothetical protein
MRPDDFTAAEAAEAGLPWPGRDWRDFDGADREDCEEERRERTQD